jgi:hypothetical protein
LIILFEVFIEIQQVLFSQTSKIKKGRSKTKPFLPKQVNKQPNIPHKIKRSGIIPTT